MPLAAPVKYNCITFRYKFKFNGLVGMDATQEDVFEHIAKPVVDRCGSSLMLIIARRCFMLICGQLFNWIARWRDLMPPYLLTAKRGLVRRSRSREVLNVTLIGVSFLERFLMCSMKSKRYSCAVPSEVYLPACPHVLCAFLLTMIILQSTMTRRTLSLPTQRSDSQYTVHISYLEIYNDQGYDLLDPRHDTKSLEDLQ